MNHTEKLANFGEESSSVQFVETISVKDGVVCDVYVFEGDSSRDLAVVTVEPGQKTPLQRVLSGARTVEGFMAGKGTLTIQATEGEVAVYEFDQENPGQEVLVEVGQTMQWATEEGLVFYEICEPPYENGRYENLPENT